MRPPPDTLRRVRASGLRHLGVLGLLSGLASCAQVDAPNAVSALPEDYQTAFVEARSCRVSIDHDLKYVTVKVRPELLATYNQGPYPFPQGAVVVKEQYLDATCSQLASYTVMRKESAGYDAANGDWQWFSLDDRKQIAQSGKLARCIACHSECGKDRDHVCSE